MELQEFLEIMDSGEIVEGFSDVHLCMNALAQEALQITAELNGSYHTPEQIVELMSRLTGREVDESFRMFPPFYADCGKNIKLGKNVFINSCCQFQDQGGITIGDGTHIGPQCIIATLNHLEDPAHRAGLIPSPVTIGKNVWLGGHVCVLPGVTIGDGAIIGAGAVVTKDIPANAKAVGVPAKVVGYVETSDK